MEPIGLAILPHQNEHAPPPGHPENVRRLQPIIDNLSRSDSFTPIESSPVEMTSVERVHDSRLLAALDALERQGGGAVDYDTYVTAQSMSAVWAVVGASLAAVTNALGDGPRKSFILGRPPGHHAESRRAMGFCLVNHVAVAAQYALDVFPVKRVAIVDFDIHHGNGTQEIFYSREDVFYVSTHQYPFYPGTGAAQERGQGEGEGFTLNIPLPAGTTDRDLLEAMEGKILPALADYQPQLLLVSAGFDAHRLDPIGGFEITGQAFREIGRMLAGLAGQCCDGRIVALMEGGYNPQGNLESITNFLAGLNEP